MNFQQVPYGNHQAQICNYFVCVFFVELVGHGFVYGDVECVGRDFDDVRHLGEDEHDAMEWR